jgi:Asp/Glu/hydantoin racemase
MGISEAAITTALTLGDRFGIIAILPASVSRHRRYVRQMGLDGRFAGDIPIGVGVTGLKGDEVADRMIGVGRQLIDAHDADVLIMGCAGMAHQRDNLQTELGVPVIDPSQAAVAQAIAAVRLGYSTVPRHQGQGSGQ